MPGLLTEKTWNRIERTSVTGVYNPLNSCRSAIWHIKDALITGDGAWTVVGSCDGSTYGMDAVDRWIDYGDLVYGSNRSWIVLQQSGMGASFAQLCLFTTSNTNYTTLNVYWSEDVAFTGGDTTTAPDASGKLTLCNDNDAWIGYASSGNTTNYQINVYKTSDGSCSRVVLGRVQGPYLLSGWILDTIKNPVSWLDHTSVVGITDGGSNAWQRRQLFNDFGGSPLYVHAATPGWMNCGLAIPGMYESGYFKPICDHTIYQSAGLGGRFAVCPVGIRSISTLAMGPVGDMYDFYAVPAALTDGQSLLDGNGNDHYFHVAGDWVIGDDGTSVSYY